MGDGNSSEMAVLVCGSQYTNIQEGRGYITVRRVTASRTQATVQPIIGNGSWELKTGSWRDATIHLFSLSINLSTS